MQLSCIHCGQPFTISKDQLGGRGQCPHCGGSIRLPRAEEENGDKPVTAESTHWWENSISGLVSVVVHMFLLLVLALIGYNSYSGEGLGEDVLIGELPSEILGDADDEELDSEETTKETAEAEAEETLDVEPTIDATSETELGRHFGGGLYAAEVNWLIDEEWARDPEDVLWRRTKCGIEIDEVGAAALADYMFKKRSG